MLVNGDADYRTPRRDGGEMNVSARSKYRKVPTVLVRFPHRDPRALAVRRAMAPRLERLQHIVGWMDEWLQGKKSAAYATQ